MISAGYVARRGARRGIYRFWWGNLMERDHLEEPGIDGRIIIRWTFRMSEIGVCTG